MSRRFALLLSTAIAIAGVMTACGDAEDGAGRADDSAGAAEPLEASSLSKRQFLTRANAICTRERRKLGEDITAFVDDYVKENPGPLPEEEIFPKAVRSQVLPSIQKQLREVRALGAPSGEQRNVEAVLGEIEAAVAQAEEETAKTSGAFLREFRPAREAARAYGLRRCTYP